MPRFLAGLIAVFLPLTNQKETEGATAAAASISHVIARQTIEGATPSVEPIASVIEGEGGIDLNTTKLLAILAGMSFFALLWEQITSLDGPNAEEEIANQEMLSRADDHYLSKAALSTPVWRGAYIHLTDQTASPTMIYLAGFPTFAEPGCGTFDRSHQRDHRHRMNRSASELSQASTSQDD